jgi:hypothetical protein
MSLRLCSYNIEFFNRLFKKGSNDLKTDVEEQGRVNAIGTVLKTIDPDLIGILEAPNSRKDGTESTVDRLQVFAGTVGLRTNKAMTGSISPGVQEIAILFDPARIAAQHDPGGNATSKKNPPFSGEFYFDTDEDRINEVYKFYRPPLEVKVTVNDTGKQFWLCVVHPKSKGRNGFPKIGPWLLWGT